MRDCWYKFLDIWWDLCCLCEQFHPIRDSQLLTSNTLDSTSSAEINITNKQYFVFQPFCTIRNDTLCNKPWTRHSADAEKARRAPVQSLVTQHCNRLWSRTQTWTTLYFIQKTWQYICDHNSGKSWWILIIFTYLETECPPQVSYLLIYFTCDVNMTSLSRSWRWWAATASAACVARLRAVTDWWRSWPMTLACFCSCQWWTFSTYLVTASLFSLYLMNFMFHTTLN